MAVVPWDPVQLADTMKEEEEDMAAVAATEEAAALVAPGVVE